MKLKNEKYKGFDFSVKKEPVIGASVYTISATDNKTNKQFTVKVLETRKDQAITKLKNQIDKFTLNVEKEFFRISENLLWIGAEISYDNHGDFYYVTDRRQQKVHREYVMLRNKIKKINEKIRITSYEWDDNPDELRSDDGARVTFSLKLNSYILSKEDLKKLYYSIDEYHPPETFKVEGKYSGEVDIEDLLKGEAK